MGTIRGEYVTFFGWRRPIPARKAGDGISRASDSSYARIAFSNIRYIDAAGMEMMLWATGRSRRPERHFCPGFSRFQQNLFRSELVPYPSWRTVGFHDPHLELYEDYEMRIRLTRQYRGVYCPIILSEYRFHEGGLSKSAPIRHVEAMTYIWHKNRSLLMDLPEDQKEYVRFKLNGWLAPIARKAGLEPFQELFFDINIWE